MKYRRRTIVGSVSRNFIGKIERKSVHVVVYACNILLWLHIYLIFINMGKYFLCPNMYPCTCTCTCVYMHITCTCTAHTSFTQNVVLIDLKKPLPLYMYMYMYTSTHVHCTCIVYMDMSHVMTYTCRGVHFPLQELIFSVSGFY